MHTRFRRPKAQDVTADVTLQLQFKQTCQHALLQPHRYRQPGLLGQHRLPEFVICSICDADSAVRVDHFQLPAWVVHFHLQGSSRAVMSFHSRATRLACLAANLPQQSYQPSHGGVSVTMAMVHKNDCRRAGQRSRQRRVVVVGVLGSVLLNS